MFRNVYKKFQKATPFEKLLLFIGVAVSLIGFWLIDSMYMTQPGLSWPLIQSVFLWLLLIFVVILTDSNESIKEELSVIIKEHIDETRLLKEETKLLKEISEEQLKEIKLLRGIRKRK